MQWTYILKNISLNRFLGHQFLFKRDFVHEFRKGTSTIPLTIIVNVDKIYPPKLRKFVDLAELIR